MAKSSKSIRTTVIFSQQMKETNIAILIHPGGPSHMSKWRNLWPHTKLHRDAAEQKLGGTFTPYLQRKEPLR
ncbi:hypothetical protein PIB30_081727 [Stylosanthes scabra]|uniref:Uncharacterized protein n=1 Tax=Stylosanthes scabra TaxID=79078 RepID=A0ABU6RRL6_9FABA|nr:hypothetical protein [Stylosanthes scabra]